MKKSIIENIIKKIELELSKLKEASQTTRSYSQSDDLKSEGKYDTRAVEAKYLAEAQEVRVKQLELELNVIRNFKPTNERVIQIGSIVEFSNTLHFIIPISGQGSFEVNDKEIKTISSKTELFDSLEGLEVDDEFEHPISGKEVLITKIL